MFCNKTSTSNQSLYWKQTLRL